MLPWLQGKMRRTFFSIEGTGLEHLRQVAGASPILLYSNHASWWDGFVDLMLVRQFPCELHVMMDHQNLSKHPFLRWMGAFDVDLKSPRAAASGLRTAFRILTTPHQPGISPLVVIYAQGKIASPHQRPLQLQPGLAWLLKKIPEAVAIPMARRYEFQLEDRPHAFLQLGTPLSSADTPALEQALEQEMSSLHQKLVFFPTTGFQTLWHGGLSVNKKWERVKKTISGRTQDFDQLNR